MGLKWGTLTETLKSTDLNSIMNLLAQNTDMDYNTLEEMHPMLLSANANAQDNPTWEQAMNGPFKDDYWKAAELEYETLVGVNAWETVERESWMNVLPSTWAFKCKRYPDGTIRKFKARFCARGDRQIEGIDYFDTYAPVVNWTTIRLMLILSLILQLSTKQVDYTAAFVHAPIDKDPNYDEMTDEDKRKSGVYIQMPKGFRKPGTVLKLKRSLYGLKQSPRNFFQHLKKNLKTS